MKIAKMNHNIVLFGTLKGGDCFYYVNNTPIIKLDVPVKDTNDFIRNAICPADGTLLYIDPGEEVMLEPHATICVPTDIQSENLESTSRFG